MAVIIPPSVTPLPTPPNPSDTSTFDALAYPWSVALGPWTVQMQAVAVNVQLNATDAYNSATTAAAQAAAALADRILAQQAAVVAVNGPGTLASSTTSNTIGFGTKNFVIQTNKALISDQFLTISAGSGNYLYSRIISYDSGTGALSVTVLDTLGAGTFNSWNMAVSGPVTLPARNRLFYAAGA